MRLNSEHQWFNTGGYGQESTGFGQTIKGYGQAIHDMAAKAFVESRDASWERKQKFRKEVTLPLKAQYKKEAAGMRRSPRRKELARRERMRNDLFYPLTRLWTSSGGVTSDW